MIVVNEGPPVKGATSLRLIAMDTLQTVRTFKGASGMAGSIIEADPQDGNIFYSYRKTTKTLDIWAIDA